MAETAQVARAGYREVSTRENATFNLLTSFAATFLVSPHGHISAAGTADASGRFAACAWGVATSTTSCRGS